MRWEPPNWRLMKAPPEVELVITAPEAFAASLALRSRARMTLGALTQLISQTQKHVLLSVPFIQEGDTVGAPIYLALQSALRRRVNVDIVTTHTGLAVVRERNIGQDANGRLRYFRPQANIENEHKIGSHAKICVCDGTHAYVGSANLTMPGLNENIEMGLLVHGEVALQISRFWNSLIDQGILVQT